MGLNIWTDFLRLIGAADPEPKIDRIRQRFPEKHMENQIYIFPGPNLFLGRALILKLVFSGLVSMAEAQSEYWTRDPTFNPTFNPILEGGSTMGGVVSVTAFPGTKRLISTRDSILTGKSRLRWLTQLRSDGSIDDTFSQSLVTSSDPTLLAVYPDGGLLYGDPD